MSIFEPDLDDREWNFAFEADKQSVTEEPECKLMVTNSLMRCLTHAVDFRLYEHMLDHFYIKTRLKHILKLI